MPIYAYRCDECGFAKDVLQKISDPVLTVCLSCGKPSFKKHNVTSRNDTGFSSCLELWKRLKLIPELLGFAFEVMEYPLFVAFFIVVLTLIHIGLSLGCQSIDKAREFVCGRRDGFGFVHAAA